MPEQVAVLDDNFTDENSNKESKEIVIGWDDIPNEKAKEGEKIESESNKEIKELSVKELKALAEKKEKVEIEEKQKIEVEETKKKEEEQKVIEKERIERLAQDQGKSIEEIAQNESDKKEVERLDSVAKKEGISVDVIKENEAKDKSIVERHGNDPVKIAKALRGLQSSYDKSQNELKQIKEQQTTHQQLISDKEIDAKCEENRDRIIEQYIKLYPTEAEDLGEDVIFDRGKSLVKKARQQTIDSQQSEIRQKADDKRKQLLDDLSENDKEFRPDLDKALKETLDNQVIHNDFKIDELIHWARGKKYTGEHVKQLTDAAFKRGREQATIIGEKTKIGDAKPGSQKTYSYNLTEAEKERALTIFASEKKWSESKKFIEYEKIKEDDF